MFFLDLHLSEDQTTSSYCEYSLMKSLHYWKKRFPPILWIEIKITQGKKMTKDNRKEVYPSQSLRCGTEKQ